MGVRGLQTFLKENRRSLCRTLLLDRDGAADRLPVPVVVDAWGIIYQLYFDSLPWASGGEYFRFYRLVRRLIKAWRSVNLEPTFVFDGASPPEKHATRLERMQEQVATARMFYNISAQTRSAPSFSRGHQIIPPFAMQTFTRALSSLDVSVRFVARGEADGACVVLADQLGGYVMGKDTDFMILSAAASDNLLGYVPLDMMEWIDGESARDTSSDDAGAESFIPVAARRQQARSSRLFPPAGYRNPTLVLVTFSVPALCRRLRIPANMLPLFSSLIGNDYTPAAAADAFFNGKSKPSERIDLIARILREQLARPSALNGADSAADLVRRVVDKLCTRAYVDQHAVVELVDAIIEATIQYVLPPRHECCSIYPFCGDAGCQTSLSRMSTPLDTPVSPPEAVSAYAAARRRGLLHNMTHAWLHPDRMYLWLVMEDPAGRCWRDSKLATAARLAAYTITDEALGGMSFPEVTGRELEELQQDLEACTLLGVEPKDASETDEDDIDKDGSTEEVSKPAINDHALLERRKPPRTITEYNRQGSSSRIISRSLDLPPPLSANDVEPLTCLRPLDHRLEAYRVHLSVDTPDMAALPPRIQPLAVAVRLCILQAADDGVSPSRRWRMDEVEAVLRAGVGCLEGWDADADAETDDADTLANGLVVLRRNDLPLLTTRNAELVAQLNGALTDASFLAQALLLTPDNTSADAHSSLPLTHLAPYMFFSGTALHSLLSGVDPPPSSGWRWSAAFRNRYRDALAAVLADLPADAVGYARPPASLKSPPKSPPQQKRNKDQKAASRAGKGIKGIGSASASSSGSRFDLLLSETC